MKSIYKLKTVREIESLANGETDKLSPTIKRRLDKYQICYVGSIRQKLGLDKYYYDDTMPNYCNQCWNFANSINDISLDLQYYIKSSLYSDEIIKKYREQLKTLTRSFKSHIDIDHNTEVH